jgi:dipeptidyl aminopeptidase/acylaminoacyl peptidase
MKKILFIALAITLFACKSNKKEQTELEFGYQEKAIQADAYYSEDVTFVNEKENFTLAGTLTLPAKEGNFPSVVLISGSGLQNRNNEIMGHQSFLVLADYLTRNGIAVLRFDDRNFGESKGDAHNATTENFATDAEAAVNYLKSRNEIDKTKIGLIGHSEGGIIAPMIAAKSDDIAFIVLLAGSAIQGSDLLLMQTELVSKAMGRPDSTIKKTSEINKNLYEFICNIDDEQERKAKITEYIKETISKTPDIFGKGQSEEQIISTITEQTNAPWVAYFIRYNPAPTLEKVKCPVLAINGSKDLQVPSQVNLNAINAALTKGGNTDFKVKELEGLNHLFQECNTGSPMEYAVIKQTFSPTALDEIYKWINELFN